MQTERSTAARTIAARTIAARSLRGGRAMRWCRSTLAGCWLVLAWPAISHAEDAAAKTEARAHFDRGLQLLDGGDLNAAATEFEAANALVPAALAAYDAALAHARMNRPLAAVRLLRDARERDASPALRDKIAVLREEQLARLGKLLVRVSDTDGAPVEHAELRATGYTPSELQVGQVAVLSPGMVTFRVIAAGHPPIERTIDVQAGSRQELVVVLERGELHPPRAATEVHPASGQKVAVQSTAGESKAAPVQARALPTAGLVTAGAGAVVMATSVALLWHVDRGFVQLSPEVDAFNASTGAAGPCARGSHVSECRSRSEELNQRRADLSEERVLGFIGLGVGAMAVTAGVVWCLHATKARATSIARPPLALVITPGMTSLLATGSF